MTGFDIKTLLHFRLPNYKCVQCHGLMYSLTEIEDNGSKWNTGKHECKVCNIRYSFDDGDDYLKFMNSEGGTIKFEEPGKHAKELATLAVRFNNREFIEKGWSNYIDILMELLLNAKKFVHFTTYGMSHLMLGTLRLAAKRVKIRGIVSNPSSGLVNEIECLSNEAKNLEIRVFESSNQFRSARQENPAHQKLIIIDGLIAIDGSANLTESAWRSAAHGKDKLQAITNIGEVMELNNRYFSPVWIEKSEPKEVIDWGFSIPF